MAEGSMLDDTKLEIPIDKALLKSFPKLVTCIAKSPGEITDQLVPFSILSDEEESDLRSSRFSKKEKARKIMNIVIIKIKSEHSFLNDFISIMEEKDWMKHGVDALKRYLKLEKKNVAGECSKAKPTKVAKPKAVKSIYPPISRKRPREETEQFNESILEYKTHKIKQDFASLVTNIAMALENNAVAAFRLLFYLSALRSVRSDNIRLIKECYFSAEFIEEIKKECGSNVYKILTFLGAFYSWINFGLIESIKNTFLRHDEEIQTVWEDYNIKFKEYCKERVCKIPQHTIQTLSATHCTEVAFKMDSKWKEIRFDMLINIKAIISTVLELEPHTLYLRTVEQGCVELVFEVPQHVADVIIPPTEEQLLALQKHKIKYCGLVSVDSDTTVDFTPSYKKLESNTKQENIEEDKIKPRSFLPISLTEFRTRKRLRAQTSYPFKKRQHKTRSLLSYETLDPLRQDFLQSNPKRLSDPIIICERLRPRRYGAKLHSSYTLSYPTLTSVQQSDQTKTETQIQTRRSPRKRACPARMGVPAIKCTRRRSKEYNIK